MCLIEMIDFNKKSSCSYTHLSVASSSIIDDFPIEHIIKFELFALIIHFFSLKMLIKISKCYMYITFASAMRIRPLWLGSPEEMSPEIQNRGTSGPTKGHVSDKATKKIHKKFEFPLESKQNLAHTNDFKINRVRPVLLSIETNGI